MKLEAFEALPEEGREELADEASDLGKVVFSRDYDTGGPCGGGEDSVVRYRGLYFALSGDYGPSGPFRSLREALEQAEACLLDITSATGEILCIGMPIEELLGLFTFHGQVELLFINGEEWTLDEKNGWHHSPD